MNEDQLSPDDIENNNLVLRGVDGDPLADPISTRMQEKESYERVIEGLKIASDAAVHLVRREPENFAVWKGLAIRLDAARRIAMQKGGFESAGAMMVTEQLWGGATMGWKEARSRLREGLKQASGGARQLAVCFRMDAGWLSLSQLLEAMETKLTLAANRNTRSLIIPGA